MKFLLPKPAALCLCFGISIGAFAAKPDQPKLDSRFKLEAFDMSQVRLLDSLEKREMEADRRYLKSIDLDGLLWPFRRNAGLPYPGKSFGGWEAPDSEIRGCFTGHYLTACALMYKSTGDTWFRDRAAAVVEELAKCQTALGGKYIAAIPTSFLDRVESGKPVWAPYYVLEKLMTGLTDVSQVFGNRHALAVVEKMSEYLRGRSAKLSDGQFDITMRNEFGGMAKMEYSLYEATHNRADLEYGHRFDEAAILGPLALRHDALSGLHANTNLPKILGAARRYDIVNDPTYRTVVEYFWDRIANHRSYATGGDNKAEFWGDPDALAHSLASNNQEACTTYNMLKITRELIQWTGSPQYADFYERAYFNGILPTQRTDTGMMIYYMPLSGGDTKKWGTPRNTFWCCYCTGVESFAKLNDSIYFHDNTNLYVNLFVPSELNWKAAGFKLSQSTHFPEEQGSTFTVHSSSSVERTINLRIPYWAAGARVSVNGKEQHLVAKPTSYLAVRRKWKDGDTLHLSLPMKLHSQAMPDDPKLQALMYGPIVLAGVMDGKTPIAADLNTGYLREATSDPTTWLTPVAGKPLTFQCAQDQPLTFVPLYKIIDQPFGVYWNIVPRGSARDRELMAISNAKLAHARRIVDDVNIDEGGPNETGHNLVKESSNSGAFRGRHYRDGISFGWDLKVLPNTPMTLSVTYWGDDAGARTFDILVNGEKIATQTLNQNKPGQLFDVEYAIPASLTANAANKVTVRFRAQKGSTAGGVFDCATLKAAH